MYSFQEDIDNYEPDGEYEFLFQRLGEEENTRTVEADTSPDAYRVLHSEVGEQWKNWLCLGRKDILEYKVEEHDRFDTLREARCSTTGLHPLDFKEANGRTVERWEEE
jgi:hypothetical protein